MKVASIPMLLRPVNAAIVYLAVVSGAATVTGSLADWRIMAGALSASLVLMSGNAINDVYDVESDRVNKPHRPLPSGDLTKRDAETISVVLAILAVIVGYMININCFLVSILYASVFYFYAVWLKPLGFIGNVVVSSGTGMSLIFGALTVNGITPTTLVFAVCAFILNLGREIVKGVEDIEGDKANNCRTIPVAWGIKKSKVILYCIIAFTMVGIGVSQFWLYTSGRQFLAWYFAATVQLILIYTIGKLAMAKTKQDYGFLSTVSKIAMIAGILSMQVLYLNL